MLINFFIISPGLFLNYSVAANGVVLLTTSSPVLSFEFVFNRVHTEPGKPGKPGKYAIFTKSQGKPGIVRDFL